MRRVPVVGSSGSGKSTFGAELADRLGVPCTEFDAVHHLADGTPIEPDELVRQGAGVAARDRRVIDGNSHPVVPDGPGVCRHRRPAGCVEAGVL